jgi:hypothetical protein
MSNNTIYNKMFSDVGSNFSSSVVDLGYTLQNPAKKTKTNRIIRGFYSDTKSFESAAGIASKYFSGITLSSKYISRSCTEKIYLEVEIEHIYPDITKAREIIKNVVSNTTLPTDATNKKIVDLLKGNGSGPDLRTFSIDVSASFLFGDLYDPNLEKASIEYSTIEEENGLQFYGMCSFDEHKFEDIKRYVLCMLLDTKTRKLECQLVSRETLPNKEPKQVFYSYEKALPLLTQYTDSSAGDILFQISCGTRHYELLSFLNTVPSKYRSILEQYQKYFKEAGTIMRIRSTAADQQYKPATATAISDCKMSGDIEVKFKTPNFLLSGTSASTVKDVIEKSIQFSEDTGNDLTSKDRDLITKVEKQKIRGRLDYSLKSGERFFISIDDGKSWTEIKSSNITGREFISSELTLKEQNSRILFKYIDKFGKTVNCKTSVPYRFSPNALTHTIEVTSILNKVGDYNTKTRAQVITGKFSRKFDASCLIEGSLDDGKNWIKIPANSISADRTQFNWNVDLKEGINKVCFRTVDVAGNVGAKTGSKTIFVKSVGSNNKGSIEPFMYRHAAKLSNGKAYSYPDWYTNFWWKFLVSYKASGSDYVGLENYVLDALPDDSISVTRDESKESYYPVPSTHWDYPEVGTGSASLFEDWDKPTIRTANGVKTEFSFIPNIDPSKPIGEFPFYGLAAGFNQQKFSTSYKHQNIIGVLENELEADDTVYGSVDGGKTWVYIETFPIAQLADKIKEFKTIKGNNLVSTTLGHKAIVAYKASNLVSSEFNYASEGYTQPGFSFANSSDVNENGYRSHRMPSGTGGVPEYKTIDQPKSGKLAFIWDRCTLVEGNNNVVVKIVDYIGNETIVIDQPYVFRNTIPPIQITNIQYASGNQNNAVKFNNNVVSVDRTKIKDERRSNGVTDGSIGLPELVNFNFGTNGDIDFVDLTVHITLSRDLLEDESVEIYCPSQLTRSSVLTLPAPGNTNGYGLNRIGSKIYMKTKKVDSNKIQTTLRVCSKNYASKYKKIVQLLQTYGFGEIPHTVATSNWFTANSSDPLAPIQSVKLFVGDSAGNVLALPAVSVVSI